MSKADTPGNSNKVILHHWRVMEIVTRDGTRSRHIWGNDSANNLGRASTSIMGFDPANMTATTRSGRNYMLEGQPGDSRLGKAAWEKWRSDHGVVSESDVTEEYLRVSDQQADTSITFTKLSRVPNLDKEQ